MGVLHVIQDTYTYAWMRSVGWIDRGGWTAGCGVSVPNY